MLLRDVHEAREGDYLKDYQEMTNRLSGVVTAWKDIYILQQFTPSPHPELCRSEKQPLPHYIRWVHTKQLHYLPVNIHWSQG